MQVVYLCCFICCRISDCCDWRDWRLPGRNLLQLRGNGHTGGSSTQVEHTCSNGSTKRPERPRQRQRPWTLKEILCMLLRPWKANERSWNQFFSLAMGQGKNPFLPWGKGSATSGVAGIAAGTGPARRRAGVQVGRGADPGGAERSARWTRRWSLTSVGCEGQRTTRIRSTHKEHKKNHKKLIC